MHLKQDTRISALIEWQGKLYTGAQRAKVSVWDEQGQKTAELADMPNPAQGATTFAVHENLLYSGWSFATVYVWNSSHALVKVRTFLAYRLDEAWS